MVLFILESIPDPLPVDQSILNIQRITQTREAKQEKGEPE